MKRWRTWVIIVLIVGALAGAGYYVSTQTKLTAGSSAQTTPTVVTQNIAVRRGNITSSLSPTGQVYAVTSANLSFNVTVGTITELNVKAGQKVSKGDVLAKIDPSDLQSAVDQAQADLLSAQQTLEDAKQGPTELELRKAKLAVTQAQVSLEQAKKAKADLVNPDLTATQRAVQEAQYSLDTAKINLELAKISTAVGKTVRDLQYAVAWHERNVRYIQAQPGNAGASAAASAANVTASASPTPPAPVRSGPSKPWLEPMTLDEAKQALSDAQQALALAQINASVTLSSAQDSVARAQAALVDAQNKLATAKAPDSATLAQADNAIAQAEFKLAKAQYDLQTLQAGTDAKTLELDQAKYDAAKVTLEQAQAALAGATMTAPFDGTVISVNVQVGDQVPSSKVVMTLADLSQLQVMASVDETKITQVKVGQQAKITFDAFPGRTFKGTVLEVPIQGSLVSNVVIYSVPISLENPDKLPLKPSMTANITIVTGSKQNVLLVPAFAIQQTSDGPAVLLQGAAGGQPTLTPVQTGLTDGTYVEIVGGLNEGDVIVAQYKQATTTQQQFGGAGNQRSGILSFFGGPR
jgi:HlyD family secretion protein